MLILFIFLISSHGGLEDASCAMAWTSGGASSTQATACANTLDNDLPTGFVISGSLAAPNEVFTGDSLKAVQV